MKPIEKQIENKKTRLQEIEQRLIESDAQVEKLKDEKHLIFQQLKQLLVTEEKLKQENLRLEEQKRYVIEPL